MIINMTSTHRANNYRIYIKNDLLKDVGRIIEKQGYDNLTILTNRKVHHLWIRQLDNSLRAAGLKAKIILIPDGERFKNEKTYNLVISQLLNLGAGRNSALITFGGGVIGDLGGLAAATYMRGIGLIHIPTTLIAQVDSSIGGKVAIDHPEAKNIIGSFYNPKFVLTDPELLTTLSKKEFKSGLFEIIKIALIRDERLYQYLEHNLDDILNREPRTLRHIISVSAFLKSEIVKEDPFEKKLRMILNFGHTFGHALETSAKYRNISHGEAVGYGMLLAMQLSSSLKYFDLEKNKNVFNLIEGLLGKRNFVKPNPHKIWRTMTMDKKVKNRLVRFVLLRDIGRPFVQKIKKTDFIKALTKL